MPRFAVYRVDIEEAKSAQGLKGQPNGSKYRNTFLTQESFGVGAVIREPAILTEADIVEYCWDEQRIVLRAESAEKWNESFVRTTPLDGIPQYGAMLWSPVSSRCCELTSISSMCVGGYLSVQAAGHRENVEAPPDPRYDPQVKEIMQELGKLSEVCTEVFR